jgi:HAD superfamily hydrolase (TIGR01490 family)
MHLALFDLDHTLIPFDSGMAWTRFLVSRDVLRDDAEAVYLAACQQYVDGQLDIRALHHAGVASLAAFDLATLRQWSLEFEAEMAPLLLPAMRALVEAHQRAGHRCAIVTATTRFIAEPFGRLFGGIDVLATRSRVVDGRLGGGIDGEPCHGVHKRAHVDAWLAASGQRLDGFERSWFYSDSVSDLPLLRAVTDPVAVAPDARLRALAGEAGWPILERS